MEIEEIINNFCENIRMLRATKKLSKGKMAKILGIGQKTLTKIEAGTLPRFLKAEVLIRIYNHFGILPSKITSTVFKIDKLK